jgi:hypothetical protein
MDIAGKFKFIAKTGFILLKNVVGLLLLGIFGNWTFAISLFILPHNHSPILIFLTAIFFMLAAPIPYALLGKTYGLRKGLSYLINEQKEALIEFIILKMLSSAKTKTLDSEAVKKLVSKPAEWLSKIPKPLQFAANQLLSRFSFSEILVDFAKNQGITEENVGNVSALASKKISEKINISIIEPSTKPIWLLVGGNIVAMVATALLWYF